MSKENKLPLYTRLGIYATGTILGILGLFMLQTCARALYYGGKTTKKEISDSYSAGFACGLKDEAIFQQTVKRSSNPLLVKMYRKGFRDGRDRKGYRKNKRENETLLKEEK